MTVDAVKPAITRTAIGDAALKAALRGIVHQAAVSGRDCAAVAALAADGLAQFTGDAAWAVVVARTAVLHVRSVRGSAATLAVPRLGCELAAPGGAATAATAAAAALSVVAFRVAHDDAPAGAPAGGSVSERPAAVLGAHARRELVEHASTFASGAEREHATALVLAARAAFGLGAHSETAVAGGVKAALTAAFGSTWGVVLCPQEPALGARRKPALALPPACRARFLECSLTATTAPIEGGGGGGGGSYRLFAYQLPPRADLSPPATAAAYVVRHGWVLARMALYALAAACLCGYFAFGHALSSKCARAAVAAVAAAAAAVDLGASGGGSGGGEPGGLGAPPAGCSEAQSRAAEARLALSPWLMYAGLAALAVLSALRLAHGFVQRSRMKALLTRLAAAGAAGGAGAAGDVVGTGAAGGAAAGGGAAGGSATTGAVRRRAGGRGDR